ncbi:MAG: TetR/AcrR family transcriptional regulator [Anaerolineae bacterium]|nr:TetR/AcrR family transcriptional regulator [Anaerolineae bacterium]
MAIQQRSEETYTRILDAAAASFSRNGYDATGVAEICNVAGISKGAFYYHFPSKQALFIALLERWLDELDSSIATLQAEASTVPEALTRMAEAFQAVLHTADGNLPMFMEFMSAAQRDSLIWEATIQPYRRYQLWFAMLIEKGVAEGSLRPMDPQIASQMLVSWAVGMLLQSTLDLQVMDWSTVMRESLRLMLTGLLPECVA